jgi:hypothetical protein
MGKTMRCSGCGAGLPRGFVLCPICRAAVAPVPGPPRAGRKRWSLQLDGDPPGGHGPSRPERFLRGLLVAIVLLLLPTVALYDRAGDAHRKIADTGQGCPSSGKVARRSDVMRHPGPPSTGPSTWGSKQLVVVLLGSSGGVAGRSW